MGSHSVVPRCGAGGAPRWWGPTLLGAPHPASPRLTLRTTWSSRSLRPLLTVSLVLTVSLRRAPRSHGYLTNDGDSPGEGPPPQEGSRERPTDTTRAESAQALPSGSPTPAVTGVAHVVPRVWSTPVVGAPCRRASTARHQGPGWTQPETHHRISLTRQGWVALHPVAHHTRGTPQEEEPPRPHTRGARTTEADSRRLTDHQEGTTTQGHPKRDPTQEGPHTGTPPNQATALADQHDQGTPPQAPRTPQQTPAGTQPQPG